MKKITLILFAFVAFCCQSYAQLNEGFDGAGLPAGWTQTQVSGAIDWVSGATQNQNASVAPRTGPGMAYFFASNYNHDMTRLESPSQDLTTLTTPVLTFYYTQVDWGGDQDKLSVWYKDGAAGTWTMIEEYSNSVSDWTEVNIVLPSPSADYYIAFQGDGFWGRGVTVDDVSIAEAPACLPPGSLNATPTSTATADLSWVAAGSEGDWTYEYGATGYTQGAGALGSGSVTAEVASISGLTVGTTYDFYVQANCGGGDGDSSYAGPFTWTQPAEGGACGTAIQGTVEADCATATPLTLDFSNGNAGGGSCDSFNNTVIWVKATTPATGDVEITMSIAADVAVYDACNGTEVACNAGTPYITTGLAPNTEYFFAIWVDAVDSTDTGDLCIQEAPTCLPIDGTPTIDLLTDIQLDFSYLAPPGGTTPVGYNWEVVPDGNAQGVGTVASGTEAAGDLSATTGATLTASTAYDLYVVTDCGGGDNAIGGPYSFTTNSGPAPSNDECVNAINVTMETEIVDAASATVLASGSVANGIVESEPAAVCNGFTGNAVDDMWYTFTALAANVNITFEHTWDAVTTLYSGTCGAFTELDCADAGVNEEMNATGLTPGETYYVRIYSYGATNQDPGDFDLKIWTPDVNLSVDESEINTFRYFPNPVKNTLTLSAQNTIEDVVMYNMLGQEVLRVTPNAVNSELDMSSLQTGAYFVKVTINNNTETIRVVKQ